MVNTVPEPGVQVLPPAAAPLVAAYVVIAVGTLPLLAVLSALAPSQAGPEAWGHAAVVGALAVILPVRLRSAGRGSERGRVAVVLIAGVLVVANFVEAVVPGLFPGWMRLEMLLIAALMTLLLVSFARSPRHPR